MRHFVVKATPWQQLLATQKEFEEIARDRNRSVYKFAKSSEFARMDVVVVWPDKNRWETQLEHVGSFGGRVFVYERKKERFFSGSGRDKVELGSGLHGPKVRYINPTHKDWPLLVQAIIRLRKPEEEQKKSA